MKKLLAITLGAVLVISGCNLFKSEKDRFIDATVESTCYVFEQDNVYDETVEAKVKEIYADYGFDSEDKEAMEAVGLKYKGDEEVQTAILQSLTECGSGLFDGMSEEVLPTPEAAGDDTTEPVTEVTDPAAEEAAETTPAE